MSHASLSYSERRTFADIDDLTETARQWDLDFRQLRPGNFYGELFQFGCADVHISDARFCRSIVQKGAPPQGMRTIAVPGNPDTGFVWRNQQIDGNSLMLFPPGAELSSVSGPDFHVYTCSFPEHLLAAAGEEFDMDGGSDPSRTMEAVQCRPETMTALRRRLQQLCRSADECQTAAVPGMPAAEITRGIPQHLMRAVAEATGVCSAATSRKRTRALTAADTFIERFAREEISVSDLCRAAGVSQRTLEYAFADRYGMSPKRYLTMYRLSAVRRQLRHGMLHRDRVFEAANEWGFWHMGQFAADYKQQFGELPSETLRRSV